MGSGKHWGRGGNLLWGIVLIILGVVFLGQRYHWWGLNIDLGLDKIWPLFIVAAGIYLIMKRD
jgi:hypothetical protein